jgi:starch phosphorylase
MPKRISKLTTPGNRGKHNNPEQSGQTKQRSTNLPRVAYFCMEYGLQSDFKIYAGGLGILAGDYLKGAKDYGYPIVGVGILWKQGYGDQVIDADGRPYDAYKNNTYDFLKDTRVKVNVDIRGRNVACKVWLVDAFGNAPLYLLDTDLPENADAWITGQLYGWFGEERIAQEMVLGIGGVRALRALGIEVDVYHFNEGHALFAGFELLREEMALEDGGRKMDEIEEGAREKNKEQRAKKKEARVMIQEVHDKKEKKPLSFKEAMKKVRKKIVFTTHTPVVQGNESHPVDRLLYMGANMHLTKKQMLKIGGTKGNDHDFNMTVGGLRLCRKANAVAQLHGETANKMWAHVRKRADIIAITNGIHIPTWVDESWQEAVGSKSNPQFLSSSVPQPLSSSSIWDIHMKNKKALVKLVKERTGAQLDAKKLIIGFSRRAVAYKRSDLIFSNLKIIGPLLKDQTVQIIFSGKSHPLDDAGKEIVANLVSMSKKYPNAVVFLENYDMTIGAALTRGADVWLNNPVRPKEASGTSGMKAAMNGVLNLSILDGWWPEACNHGVNGWQFGDGFESEDAALQDKHDIKALYKILTEEVVPTYYNQRRKWENMMLNSIISTNEAFSVKRMLEEYYSLLYT